MAKYERRAVLQSIANPFTEQARALDAQARSLEPLKNFALKAYEQTRIEDAKVDAAEKEFIPGAPLGNLSPATSYGRAYNQANELGYLAATKNAYMDKLDQYANEYKSDPDAFIEVSEAYKQETINSLPAQIRQQAAMDFDAKSNNLKFQIRDNAAAIALAESTSQIKGLIDRHKKEIAGAARIGNEKYLQDQLTGFQESVVKAYEEMDDFDAARKALNDINAIIDEQTVLGAYERYAKEGQGAAFIKNFMDQPPADLSPEQTDKYLATMSVMENRRQTAEKEAQAELSIEQQRTVSDTLASIGAGILQGEDAVNALDMLHANKLITTEKRTTHLTNILEREKERQDKAERMAGVANFLKDQDATTYIPEENFTEYFDDVLMPSLAGQSAEQQANAVSEFVTRSRNIPTRLKTHLNKLVKSNDPEQLRMAAEIADKVSSVPGAVGDIFDTSTEAFVETAVGLMENMTPAEAIRVARESTNPLDKGRIEIVNDELKKKDLEDYRSDALGEIESFFGPDARVLDRDQIASEYRTTYETFRRAGMDDSAAKKRAAKTLQRNWGEFEGEIIKYPPNKFYAVGDDSSYIMKQLKKDMAEQTIGMEGPVEVMIRADSRTAREASTGKPTYMVYFRDQYGSMTPLFGQRWSPDMNAERKRIETNMKRKLSLTEQERQAEKVMQSDFKSL